MRSGIAYMSMLSRPAKLLFGIKSYGHRRIHPTHSLLPSVSGAFVAANGKLSVSFPALVFAGAPPLARAVEPGRDRECSSAQRRRAVHDHGGIHRLGHHAAIDLGIALELPYL